MTNPPRPGYWLANDGKWYPPELHPDRIRERLAAEREQSRGASAVSSSPAEAPSTSEPAAEPETETLASPMPHPSTPPLAETPEDLKTPEVLPPLATGPTDAELEEIERAAELEANSAEFVPEQPPVEVAEIPEPEAEVVVSDLTDVAELEDSAPIADANEPADTVPLVPTPAVPEVSEVAPDAGMPDTVVLDESLVAGAVDVPDVPDVPDIPEAPEVVAAPNVLETPDVPDVPAAPELQEFPKADVGADSTSQATPVRSPIPEPFPEASADDLVEAEPQKSFVRRWWLPVLLVLGALALVNFVIMPYIDTDRTSAEDENQLNVFELATGTCISEVDLEAQTELKGTVERVACSEEHTHEIFHTVNHQPGAFDRALIEEFATEECLGMFETYTGEFYSRSQLKFILLLPNEKAWDKEDRTTICALFGDAPRTESARS